MSVVTQNIGKNIRFYRKSQNMTLQELGDKICKGKAAVSKYENGQISIDIQTLYDIAEALEINVSQLLYTDKKKNLNTINDYIPDFFRGLDKLYAYYYDGRNATINESIITIHQSQDISSNEYQATLFMNIKDYEHYQICEYSYFGKLIHYEALSVFTLQNNSTAMEELKIAVPASYMNEEKKFALFNGVSSRPLMPVSLKMLFSKNKIKKDSELIKELKISKYDIQTLKLYNMFTVT